MRRFALLGCLLLGACSFEVAAVQSGSLSSDGGDDGQRPDLLAPDLRLAPIDQALVEEERDLAPVDPPDLAEPDLTTPPDLTVTGLLQGERTATASTNDKFSLSDEGELDWSHWGRSAATDFNHKRGGGNLTVAPIPANATVLWINFTSAAISWNDGTPTMTESGTKGGIYTSGLNDGFAITAPADTTTRTLVVYVGYYHASATLNASLSDHSADDYTDTVDRDTSGLGSNARYQITYRANSKSQLTVKWTLTADGGSGSVGVQAATLR